MNPFLPLTEKGAEGRRMAISFILILLVYVGSESWGLSENGLPRLWPVTALVIFILYRNLNNWPLAAGALLIAGTIVGLLQGADLAQVLFRIYSAASIIFVAYVAVVLIHRHLDIRHGFHSRKGVINLCLAWFQISSAMTIPRVLGMTVMGMGDVGSGQLFIQILLMELTGLMIFTPLFLLYNQLATKRVKGVLWGPIYGIAALQVTVIVALASILDAMPIQSIFLLAMIATPFILISSYYGGFPGVTVSIVVTGISFLYIIPLISDLVQWESATSLAVTNLYFLTLTLTGLVINGALSENREGWLQMNDRVSENANLILDLISFQADNLQNETEMGISLKVAESRLMAMNVVNKIVQRGQKRTVDMGELFQEVWTGTRKSKGDISMSINVKGASLQFREAVYLALIFSELVDNSMKHAFPSGEGRITVQLRKEPEVWKILIGDDGIGMPEVPGPERLGITLVENLVTKQLKGGYVTMGPPGTKWLIWFPRYVKHGK